MDGPDFSGSLCVLLSFYKIKFMAFDKPSVPTLHPQSSGLVLYLPLILALTAGLMLTGLLFLMVSDWENERTRHNFTEAASARIRSAQDNLMVAIDDVDSLRDFFVATEFEPSRDAVHAFTAPALARHHWLHALSFNRLVTDEQRASFEKSMQKNMPGYRIADRDVDGKLLAAAKRSEYIPVVQIEPYIGNEAALGYDIFSDPTRRQGITDARNTGRTVATGRIKLVQGAQQDQFGFLIFSPIHAKGGADELLTTRFIGLSVGVIRANDIIAGPTDVAKDINLQFIDRSAPANEQALTSNGDLNPENSAPSTQANNQALRTEQSIHVAGRDWRIVATPANDNYSTKTGWLTYASLLIGLLFSALFGLLTQRSFALWKANSTLSNEISDRKNAQQALLESENQLRLITNAMPAVISYTDKESRVRFHNKIFSQWIGLTNEEITGRSLEEIMKAEDFASIKPRIEAALLGMRQDYERSVVLREGTPATHTIVNLIPHFNEDKQVIGVFSMTTDISARKKMEVELAAEKERAQVTLASIGEGVITSDAKGKLVYMNPVAEELIGTRLENVRGKPVNEVFSFISEGEREPMENPLLRCIREKQVVGLNDQSVLLRPDGTEYPIDDSTAPILDSAGQTLGAVLVFSDVSQQRFLSRQLTHQASHDPLTGLINRREFEERLKRAISEVRGGKLQHVLFFMDLDQFKVVNDTCGHVAGDALLRQISAAFERELRHSDTLARLGGDEFGVLLEHCPTEQAMHIADQLLKAARDLRFTWGGRAFPIGVSIGLIAITTDSESHTEIMRSADAACYVAKDRGRNRVQLFLPDDAFLARRTGDMQWLTRIGHALEENRFVLYGQPIRALSKNANDDAYVEVLVRMNGEDGQLISPGAFIPAAERYNLMPQLDRWVVNSAVAWYAEQLHSNRKTKLPTLGINLSGASVSDAGFLEFIRTTLKARDVPARALCFEITETAAITHMKRAVHFMNELRETGCRFALDDFGSGMSSFAYLKNLPVDFIKIDGNFVRDMHKDVVDLAMTEAINRIGHVMNIPTIAESVENQETLEMLEELGVNYAQGYHIARPMLLDQLLVVPAKAVSAKAH
jgi:diguanylate cyclase (GGDEF)-like protein/PAS domain S-box-containing protein